MRSFKALIASCCILLTGCSNDYPLKAVFIDGALHFVGAENAFYFGKTGFCPSYFSVRNETGETIWRIEADGFVHPCNLFPAKYGVAPEGWKTVVPHKPLESGEL